MCGIFGIITPKPRKLDLRAFCVLGVNNDSRGGDSCGIFIDKRYEYGVNEYKLFYNFFPRSKILNSVTTCQIALGHCRKASVGAINAANAQPVVLRDECGNVTYALIHNGTILNYKELARKYIPNIDITDMTDSQVMARIFYHAGYNVLGEYIGAGAFVMVDYRNEEPEVLLFKGESKPTEYSVVTQVERPLFFTYNNNEFLFSSIMDYLKALRPEREVMTLTTNSLCCLKEGKLFIVAEYDRKKLWQTKSSYSSYSSYSGYSKDSNYGTGKIVNILKKGSEDNIFHNQDFGKDYWNDIIDMDADGIYTIGDKKAHGIFWVDAIGNVDRKKRYGTLQVAFWEGVLLKNANCYSFLSKLSKDTKLTTSEVVEFMPILVHYLSPCACWKDDSGLWVTSDTPETCSPYTGTAVFPFTTEEIFFSEGELDCYNDGIPYKEALLDLTKSADYKIDKDALGTFGF